MLFVDGGIEESYWGLIEGLFDVGLRQFGFFVCCPRSWGCHVEDC